MGGESFHAPLLSNPVFYENALPLGSVEFLPFIGRQPKSHMQNFWISFQNTVGYVYKIKKFMVQFE